MLAILALRRLRRLVIVSRTGDPTFAEQRLLSYAAASASAAPQVCTMTQLADLLGIDKESCPRALQALKSRGVLWLHAHPDGRYELILGPEP